MMIRITLYGHIRWNLVQSVGKHPNVFATVNASIKADGDADLVEDVDPPTSVHVSVPIARNAEELCWDCRDAQAHALITLSVKLAIIPHIRSCKTVKDAWDILTTLYQARNEAHVAYLLKQLESEHI